MKLLDSWCSAPLLISLAASGAAQAQATRNARIAAGACTPAWAAAFGGEPGTTEAAVEAFAVFDDGSGAGPLLHVAGSFTDFAGRAAVGLATWDGSRWEPMPGGNSLRPASRIHALTVHDDGQGGGPALYAAGYLGASFQTDSFLARWDGAAWSPVGAGPSREVYALGVFDDGLAGGPKLYAGSNGRLEVWNGTSWSSVPGVPTSDVFAMTVFDDGSGPALFVGGSFTAVSGMSMSRIAKWDGTSWSPLASGLNGVVRALTVYDAGLGDGPELVAGGDFTVASGVSARRVARWNGQTWRRAAAGQAAMVRALTVVDEGAGDVLFAGGLFTGGIARWDGSAWSGLSAGVSGGEILPGVWCLAVHDDGGGPALFAGGDFDVAGQVPVGNVARWVSPTWSSLGETGFNGPVHACLTVEEPSGRALVVGGDFSGVGGALARRVASWNGVTWESLGSGFDADVRALAMFDDGGGPALFAAGDFTEAGGAAAGHVARWDGSTWTALGSGVYSKVYAMDVYDDGLGGGPALYLAGEFSQAGGQPAHNIAKWDGSSWSPLGGLSSGGASSYVAALSVFDDGGGPELYAGGNFLHAGGVDAYFIARWDGTAWSPVRNGLIGIVSALTVFDDGTGEALYAGGDFEQTGGGATVNHIAQWNGDRWSALGGGISNEVHSLAVFDDGSGPALFAGGLFSEAGGIPAPNLARWDGSAWSAPPGGPLSYAFELFAFDDVGGAGPALLVGLGGHTPYLPETGDSFLGRWQGCLDTSPPVLVCPDDLLVQDRFTGPPGEVVHFQVSVADETDPAPNVVCVPPSGSLFPPGVTSVVCTATDASGNQSTCAFDVEVARKVRRR